MSQLEIRQMMNSYWTVRDVYQEDFDARMAFWVLKFETFATKHRITLYQSAMEFLATHLDSHTDEENTRLDHEIRAMLVWNSVESGVIEAEIKRLMETKNPSR